MTRRFASLVILAALVLAALPAAAQPSGALPFSQETIFFPSAARTATTTSAWFINNQASGLALICNATAITATPIVTFTVEVWNPATASAVGWIGWGTGTLDAVETIRLGIIPGATTNTAAGITDISNGMIPSGAAFRLSAGHADADSITYSCVGWPVS